MAPCVRMALNGSRTLLCLPTPPVRPVCTRRARLVVSAVASEFNPSQRASSPQLANTMNSSASSSMGVDSSAAPSAAPTPTSSGSSGSNSSGSNGSSSSGSNGSSSSSSSNGSSGSSSSSSNSSGSQAMGFLPTGIVMQQPKWPKSVKKRLEDVTIERVHEADVTPAVYDFKLWKNHRSRWRFLSHMVTLASSAFLRDLTPPLVWLMALSAAVGCYSSAVDTNVLAGWPNLASAAPDAFKNTAFALSMLLVFRTNSSYSRWLDARKLWGSLVNRTRDFARQALMVLPANKGTIKAALLRWTSALPRTIKAHLREDGDVIAELQNVLEPHELDYLAAASHRPLAVLQAMSSLVSAAELDSNMRCRVDENLTVMEDVLGGCERILRTPIPLSYTRHTARFLTIWLAMLPFAMWQDIHWYVVPVSGLIGFLLLGIDQIAIHLEEPFGILPLEAICDTITRNLDELRHSEQRLQVTMNMTLLHSQQRHNVWQGVSDDEVLDVDADPSWMELMGKEASWHMHSIEGNDYGYSSSAWRSPSVDDC